MSAAAKIGLGVAADYDDEDEQAEDEYDEDESDDQSEASCYRQTSTIGTSWSASSTRASSSPTTSR